MFDRSGWAFGIQFWELLVTKRIATIDAELRLSSIANLLPRLRSREVTAQALVHACLARIEERDSEVRAWTFIEPDLALEQARALDHGPIRGPLHGLPIAVKDIFDTFDMPTCCGSDIYAGRRPTMDAPVIAMLRRAGVVILGKTVTTELACFHPGPTANPHALERTPGGSSSGSAAAVADGMVPLALGSQTAASVVRPAAFCGVVGFKARHGSFPMNGVSAVARSLDSFGWMTRSVADATIIFEAMTGLNTGRVPGSAPRIGVCRTPEWAAADEELQLLLETTAQRLEDAGASTVEVVLPPSFDGLVDAQKTVMAFETAQAMTLHRTLHESRLSPQLLTSLDEGAKVPYEAYQEALASAAQGRAEWATISTAFDALLAPSVCGEAPLGLQTTGDPVFGRRWTLLGMPCVALPVGVSSNGMPLGLQLIGSMHDEAGLLGAARWLERAVSEAEEQQGLRF